MKSRIDETFLSRIFDQGYILWQESIKESVLSIAISYPKEHEQEGELRLTFMIDGEAIYETVFILTEGAALGIQQQRVCLITTVQGEPGKIDLIKKATKLCHDSSPLYLLLAAVQAVALSLNVRVIAGMRSRQSQRGADPHSPHARKVFFDYEQFWHSLAGDCGASSFYTAPIPFPEKPLSLIRPNLRKRAMHRREIRKRVYQSTLATFTSRCLKQLVGEEKNSACSTGAASL
jgi:uncharacterized protein VirK/YbjX